MILIIWTNIHYNEYNFVFFFCVNSARLCKRYSFHIQIFFFSIFILFFGYFLFFSEKDGQHTYKEERRKRRYHYMMELYFKCHRHENFLFHIIIILFCFSFYYYIFLVLFTWVVDLFFFWCHTVCFMYTTYYFIKQTQSHTSHLFILVHIEVQFFFFFFAVLAKCMMFTHKCIVMITFSVASSASTGSSMAFSLLHWCKWVNKFRFFFFFFSTKLRYFNYQNNVDKKPHELTSFSCGLGEKKNYFSAYKEIRIRKKKRKREDTAILYALKILFIFIFFPWLMRQLKH